MGGIEGKGGIERKGRRGWNRGEGKGRRGWNRGEGKERVE